MSTVPHPVDSCVFLGKTVISNTEQFGIIQSSVDCCPSSTKNLCLQNRLLC